METTVGKIVIMPPSVRLFRENLSPFSAFRRILSKHSLRGAAYVTNEISLRQRRGRCGASSRCTPSFPLCSIGALSP